MQIDKGSPRKKCSTTSATTDKCLVILLLNKLQSLCQGGYILMFKILQCTKMNNGKDNIIINSFSVSGCCLTTYLSQHALLYGWKSCIQFFQLPDLYGWKNSQRFLRKEGHSWRVKDVSGLSFRKDKRKKQLISSQTFVCVIQASLVWKQDI